MANIIILSYPRSGNTLTTLILISMLNIVDNPNYYDCLSLKKGKLLTKEFINNLKKDKLKNNHSCKDLIFKEHFINPLQTAYDDKKDILILVLRNYKECITRHLKRSVNEIVLNENLYINQLNKYLNNIHKFNSWNGPKKIIYYENLITNTNNVIDELYNFLKLKSSVEEKYCIDTINNIDSIKKNGIDIYI